MNRRELVEIVESKLWTDYCKFYPEYANSEEDAHFQFHQRLSGTFAVYVAFCLFYIFIFGTHTIYDGIFYFNISYTIGLTSMDGSVIAFTLDVSCSESAKIAGTETVCGKD